MHPDLVSQTIFCEMVRHEQNGASSLIGIFPDNVTVHAASHSPSRPNSEPSPVLPNLCAYTRTRLPLDRPIKGPIVIALLSPSGSTIVENSIDKDFIEKSANDARNQGNEHVMMLSEIAAHSFPIPQPGRFQVQARYAGQSYFSGAINIIIN